MALNYLYVYSGLREGASWLVGSFRYSGKWIPALGAHKEMLDLHLLGECRSDTGTPDEFLKGSLFEN